MILILFQLALPALAQETTIPVIPSPKHPIGYACLKDVQGPECFEPFKRYSAEGEALPEERPLPSWSKLTRDQWKALPRKMVAYDEYGFEVVSSTQDKIEVRLSENDKKTVTLPKSVVQKFYPFEQVPFCQLYGKEWWKSLYKDDLKTSAGLDLSRAIPGNPYGALEPIGVLKVTRNSRSEICSEGKCTPAKVSVDPSEFKAGSTPSRGGPVTELNLGFEHFSGDLKVGAADGSRTDRLLVYGKKDADTYLLGTIIYNKPKVWVKLKPELRNGAAYVENDLALIEEVSQAANVDYRGFTRAFLEYPSIRTGQTKWVNGQLWIQVTVQFFEVCTYPERDAQVLGTYWIPYSETTLAVCPKGC